MSDAIVTRVAHTGADELRMHGRRVFGQLLGHTSVGQMLVLGATGRLLDHDELAIVDDIVTAMSSADPRLWPFKVTRLACSYGTAPYGVAATLVAGEGGMYGSNRLFDTARWLSDVKRRADVAPLGEDEMTELLAAGAGFGVLYRARDERFDALMKQAELRGRSSLPHARLCLQAARVARERRSTEAHVYLAIAALCLDIGLTHDAIAALGTIVLFHDALANATEGALQAPTILQTLPSQCVEYRGREPRQSERAQAVEKLV